MPVERMTAAWFFLIHSQYINNEEKTNYISFIDFFLSSGF